MTYQPTPAGEPRPAPPAPDTPNTGRVHSFPSGAPLSNGRVHRDWLTIATEVGVLCWVTLDVLWRLF